MKSILKTAFCFMASLALISCAAPKMATGSGKPEVNITVTRLEQLKTTTLNHFVDKGYIMKHSDDFSMVFEKESNAAGEVLFGQGARVRVRLNLIDQGNHVYRLIGIPYIVGAKEEEIPGGYSQIQQHLVEIKKKAEKP